MPDRKQGYVEKGLGVLPPDHAKAELYRARQKETSAWLDDVTQQLIIQECLVTGDKRRFRLHGVATDPTHLHVLISWKDERTFEKLRRGLRESISRRLNAALRRRWLEQGGSRKRVRDQGHFDHLMKVYLPKHNGWKWIEGVGLYK